MQQNTTLFINHCHPRAPLDPEHFGLVSLGLVVVNFFEMFRDMGIGTALIQKRKRLIKPQIPLFSSFLLLLRYFM